MAKMNVGEPAAMNCFAFLNRGQGRREGERGLAQEVTVAARMSTASPS